MTLSVVAFFVSNIFLLLYSYCYFKNFIVLTRIKGVLRKRKKITEINALVYEESQIVRKKPQKNQKEACLACLSTLLHACILTYTRSCGHSIFLYERKNRETTTTTTPFLTTITFLSCVCVLISVEKNSVL